jgi:hypothetical protein
MQQEFKVAMISIVFSKKGNWIMKKGCFFNSSFYFSKPIHS